MDPSLSPPPPCPVTQGGRPPPCFAQSHRQWRGQRRDCSRCCSAARPATSGWRCLATPGGTFASRGRRSGRRQACPPPAPTDSARINEYLTRASQGAAQIDWEMLCSHARLSFPILTWKCARCVNSFWPRKAEQLGRFVADRVHLLCAVVFCVLCVDSAVESPWAVCWMQVE